MTTDQFNVSKVNTFWTIISYIFASKIRPELCPLPWKNIEKNEYSPDDVAIDLKKYFE